MLRRCWAHFIVQHREILRRNFARRNCSLWSSNCYAPQSGKLLFVFRQWWMTAFTFELVARPCSTSFQSLTSYPLYSVYVVIYNVLRYIPLLSIVAHKKMFYSILIDCRAAVFNIKFRYSIAKSNLAVSVSISVLLVFNWLHFIEFLFYYTSKDN